MQQIIFIVWISLQKQNTAIPSQYSEFGSIQDWRIQGADPERPWNIAGHGKDS